MNIDNLFFILLFSFIFFIILVLLSNANRPYLMAIKNSAFGVLTLVLVYIFGKFFGIVINLNFFTACISCVLGFPGTLLLIFINQF